MCFDVDDADLLNNKGAERHAGKDDERPGDGEDSV